MDVREAILADPSGRAHTEATVTDLYRTLGGRAPTSGELAYWQGAVRGGQDFDDVSSAILGDPLGRSAAGVIALYETYGGREPGVGELDYWRPQLTGGATLTQVRAAIPADALRRDHTTEVIGDLYADYGGRAPTAGEVSTWQGLVAGGLTYDDARRTIVADGLGQTYQPTRIAAEYREHFGRDPQAGEVAAWRGLVNRGVTYDQMTDTLLRDGGAAGTNVQRFAGTAAADVFEIAAGRDAVITGFDPLHDLLALPGTGSGDPFAQLGTRQVFALDGTPDVLFTSADGHEVLLTGVWLDDLWAGSFAWI